MSDAIFAIMNVMVRNKFFIFALLYRNRKKILGFLTILDCTLALCQLPGNISTQKYRRNSRHQISISSVAYVDISSVPVAFVIYMPYGLLLENNGTHFCGNGCFGVWNLTKRVQEGGGSNRFG